MSKVPAITTTTMHSIKVKPRCICIFPSRAGLTSEERARYTLTLLLPIIAIPANSVAPASSSVLHTGVSHSVAADKAAKLHRQVLQPPDATTVCPAYPHLLHQPALGAVRMLRHACHSS